MPLLYEDDQRLNPQQRSEGHIPPWTILVNPSTSPPLASPIMSEVQTGQDVPSMAFPPEAPSPPQSAGIPPFLRATSQNTGDYGTPARPQPQPRTSISSLSSDEEVYGTRSHQVPPQSPERPPSTPEIASLEEAPTPPSFLPPDWDDPDTASNTSWPTQSESEVPLLSDTDSFATFRPVDQVNDLSALIDRCNASSFDGASETVRTIPNGRFRLQGWAGAAPEGSTMMSPNGSPTTMEETAPAGSWLDQCMSVICADEILRERWEQQLENCFSAVYDTLELHELSRRIPGIGSGQSSYSTVPSNLPTERRRRYTVPSAVPIEPESAMVRSDQSGDIETGLRATWRFNTDEPAGLMSLIFERPGSSDWAVAVLKQDEIIRDVPAVRVV